MRRAHIVSFDMMRLGVRQRTQIFSTREAAKKPFTMDFRIIIVLLTLVLSTRDVVKGSLKSKSDGSFDSKNVKNFCTTCKVTRRLGNHTVEREERVTMRCAFRGVHPTNITWLKNGKRLKTTKNVVIGEWVNHNGSRLRIKKVTSMDVGTYSCVGHNARDEYTVTTGYVRIKRADRGHVKQTVTIPKVLTKQRDGKCEMYKGTICAPYIQNNVLIFVEKDPKKSQDFIETKLKFGYEAMDKNLTKSCRPATLPLWCHYHFPTCSVVNSKAEPKSICKSECNRIQSQYCKAEYEWTTKASTQSSEDDLFPDCKKLPIDDPLQANCVSIKRHVSALMPGSPNKPASGQCKVYNGDVCGKKKGKKVFVKNGMEISDIEKVIKETLKKRSYVSKQCQAYVEPLLCQLRLPECDSSSSKPKGKPICQDECLVLKNKFCKNEYSDKNKVSASSIFFDCSSVPKFTRKGGKCSTIGVPSKHLQDSSDEIIPPPTKRPMIGMCQPYKGTICKKFLDKKTIFVEVDNKESNIERKLKIAYRNINSFPISPKCQPFVLPLLCHHLFPYCESNSQPKPSYICREECFRVQNDYCPDEYILAEEEALTGSILFPRCQDLTENDSCTSLRRHFITNKTEPIFGDCYRDNGVDYKGFTNTTESGTPCQRWDKIPELNVEHNFCRNPKGRRKKPWCYTLDEENPEMCNIPKCDPYDSPLNGTGEDYLGTLNTTSKGNPCQAWKEHEPERNWAHNYCRNPKGSKRAQPWCYVGKEIWEFCDVPKVLARNFPESGGHLSNLLYTVIPCVVFGLIVAIVIIAICWKRHKQGPDAIKKDTRMTVTVLLPELRTIPGENILLPKLIGNGKFGTMYTGEIYSEDGSRVSRLVKVALKESREEFINQAKIWSQFHHPNLLTIEAITSDSEPMTLVYEPAGHGSLYQYLIYHSPNNPNFTKDHALLGQANLLDISRQIAAGMAYLSSHDYVHGELMTRNCQVAHSMVIKITDFTVDRDVCYFVRPNKRPIALGWMAPETLQTEILTVYSDVWAFGVLLWEIFTYGFQPYFCFTFPEVREKISNMVLLEQPRDCIPVVYGLMKNCWKKNPTHRPHFVDLHEDLNNLCDDFLDEEDSEARYVSA